MEELHVSLPIFFICRRCVDNFIISLILFPSSFVNTTLELYYNSEINYMYMYHHRSVVPGQVAIPGTDGMHMHTDGADMYAYMHSTTVNT